MPTVPVYSSPTAAPDQLPGVREQAPYRLMYAAEVGPGNTKQFGQGLEKAGADLSQVATAEQIQNNEAAAKEYDANLMGGIQAVLYGSPDDPSTGFLSQKGKNAVDAYHDTVQKLQGLPQQMSQNLSNPAQQQLVQSTAQLRIQSAMVQAAQHASQQNNVYQQAAGKARIQVASSNAALAFNPLTDTAPVNFNNDDPTTNTPYQQYLGTVKSEATDQAQRQGMDADTTTAYVQSELQKAYIGTLSHLIGGGNGRQATPGMIKSAQAYYDGIKDQLTADQQDRILPVLQAGAAKDQSLNLFFDAQKAAGGATGQTAFIDDQFKQGKISAEVHDLTMQRINQADAERRSRLAENDKAVIGQVWSMAHNGQSLADLPATTLAYVKQRGLGTSVDAIFKRNDSSDFDDSKLYADQMRMSAEDPLAFAKQDLSTLSGQMTQSHWNHLVDVQTSISKQDVKGMEINRIQMQAVRDAVANIKSAGLNPTPKPGSSDADAFAGFESAAHDALNGALQANGGKLTREDARNVVQGLLKDQALSGTGYFGSSVGQTHMPVYKMTPDQRSAPWTIPDADRSQITASLTRRGLPVTEANVQRAYKIAQGIR